MNAFRRVGVAGTFAQIHLGHEKLLKIALILGNKVIIALTSDDMIINKKFVDQIPDYNTRKKELELYLKTLNINTNFEIVKLEDNYGTAISDKEQDAIVVSEDTYDVALEINKIRKKNDLEPLIIISIPLIYAEDNKTISSTRIRAGEINRYGKKVF